MVTKPLFRYVKERRQNLSKTFFLLGMVGNNQSRLFSSTPCGKKAMTSRSSRALGAGFLGAEEGGSWSDTEEATFLWDVCEGEGEREGVSLRNV